jgi:PUA-domain protein
LRKQLSKKEIKELMAEIEEKFRINNVMTKKDNVVKEDIFIKVNNKILFFYHDDKLIPTLKLILELTEKLDGAENRLAQTNIKTITVDKGAIKFVVNGADIMRPGITKVLEETDNEGFKKGDFVVIVDEDHNKPLAIGVALLDAEEMKTTNSGKVIKNIHFVGDEIWKSI